MRVLFIAHEFHGRCHIFMLNALRRQAEHVDFHLTFSDLMTPSRFMKRTVRKIVQRTAPAWAHASRAQWRQRLNDRILSLPDLDQYDLILFSECGNIAPTTYEALRKRSGAALVAWLGDSIHHTSLALGPYMQDHVEHMDRLFFPDQRWCREAGEKASFLPYGADFETYREYALTPSERAQLHADVAHVGILTPPRIEALETISAAGFDVGVWGASAYKWSRFFSSNVPAPLRATIRSGTIQPEQAGRVYGAADIVLNVHSPQFSDEGINNRTFEVGACGAFQVLNFTPQLPGHNEGIDGLVTFDTAADLKEKVAYFLKHDDERRQRARTFSEAVKTYHTYDNRILDIFNRVEAYRARST